MKSSGHLIVLQVHLGELPYRFEAIKEGTDRGVGVYCHRGRRSLRAIDFLREIGSMTPSPWPAGSMPGPPALIRICRGTRRNPPSNHCSRWQSAPPGKDPHRFREVTPPGEVRLSRSFNQTTSTPGRGSRPHSRPVRPRRRGLADRHQASPDRPASFPIQCRRTRRRTKARAGS